MLEEKECEFMDNDLLEKNSKLWLFGKEVLRGKKISD